MPAAFLRASIVKLYAVDGLAEDTPQSFRTQKSQGKVMATQVKMVNAL